jgi:transposase InsO family protein
MSKPVHTLALFRLSVLGPLTNRKLEHGEVKAIVRELASKSYNIPDSRRNHLSESTIMRWHYDWQRGGIEALAPNARSDKGHTQLSAEIQSAVLKLKKDNPSRSLNTIISMCRRQGLVAKNELSRASLHRFLRQQHLSKRIISDVHTIERRSFEAICANDIWHGDVLHGPTIQTSTGRRKTYLVSLIDDSSRLITHSAFCFGETALDIENVLKQAILKRGLCCKLIIDNGPAYRSYTLQSICAILGIRLVFCRPYEPEGKGKLERFHSTFRSNFLNEIDINKISGLDDLNIRLWAWLEQVYHCRPHEGLRGKTPIDRWREDLVRIKPLGSIANKIDDIFCHRYKRFVRKDATISWEGKYFEVHHNLVGDEINLVVDPHTKTALKIESLSGDDLGSVAPLDKTANLNRRRQRPHNSPKPAIRSGIDSVELAFEEYSKHYSIPASKISNEEK